MQRFASFCGISDVAIDTRLHTRDPLRPPRVGTTEAGCRLAAAWPRRALRLPESRRFHMAVFNIAHMNADQLVVFDTKKREVVATLDVFPNVHGVWAVPELGRIYASAAGASSIVTAAERPTANGVDQPG